MKAIIYLDACAIQRPLDALTTSRLRLEAEAVEALLESIARDEMELAWSPALDFECLLRAPTSRANYARAARKLSRRWVEATPSVVRRSRILVAQQRLTPLDALHVASAEAIAATLITTDTRLRHRALRAKDLKASVIDPVQAVAQLLGS